MKALFAAASFIAAMPALAASIQLIQLIQPGPDSLTYVVDSVITSTSTGTFNRYNVTTGAVSLTAPNAPPSSNLIGFGTNVWFTRSVPPYRIVRSDLSHATGDIDHFTPNTTTSPFFDMVLAADDALWATNPLDGRVWRVPRTGGPSSFTTHIGTAPMDPRGITRGSDGNVWFTDSANRRITRIHLPTRAFTDFAVPGNAVPERITGVGTPGGLLWFATPTGFGSLNPLNGGFTIVQTEAQAARRIAAAADGTLWVTNGTPFVTQFTPPANYAKLRVFTADNAQSAGLYIHTDGTVYVGDGNGSWLARIAVAQGTPPDTTVIEYFNNILGHYFVTANPGEAAAIDNGAAGPGWTKTGQQWKAWVNGPIPLAAEVCRFYGSTVIDPATGQRRGPNSHFYTLEPAECAAVKTDLGWTYEAPNKFWMIKPVNSVCPTWTQPVYRVYNNRFAQNDSNHRYMTSQAIYAQMQADGWLPEGVVMCAPMG